MQLMVEVRPSPMNPHLLQWIGGRPGVGLGERTIVALMDDGRTVWEAAIENAYGVASPTIVWPQANVVLVGTYSDVYALDLWTGESRSHWELDAPGPEFAMHPDLDRLLIFDWQNIRCLTPVLETAWYAQWVAVDGIKMLAFEDGLMVVNACYDPPDLWERVTLDLATGIVQSRVPVQSG